VTSGGGASAGGREVDSGGDGDASATLRALMEGELAGPLVVCACVLGAGWCGCGWVVAMAAGVCLMCGCLCWAGGGSVVGWAGGRKNRGWLGGWAVEAWRKEVACSWASWLSVQLAALPPRPSGPPSLQLPLRPGCLPPGPHADATVLA
jgi:hypothetical protein